MYKVLNFMPHETNKVIDKIQDTAHHMNQVKLSKKGIK